MDGEAEVGVAGCACLDGHLHGLLAELFVDGSKSVIAGGQTVKIEVACGIGHGEEGRRRDVDEGLHPGMVVAADRDHRLGLREAADTWGSVRTFRDIDGIVADGGWHGVDVVHGRVAVAELDLAAMHDRHDMRCVDAALLVDHGGF